MAKRLLPVLDVLALLVSVGVLGAVSVWLWNSGALSQPLLKSENPVWYLIRSAGVTSYLLLTAAVVWGLLLSSRIFKDWSPGSLSMALHSTVSWMGALLGLLHGLLLTRDTYFTYTVSEILIPFRGPYKPEFVGLGTLAFWLMLIIAISFWVKRWIGHRAWRLIHMCSYLAFGLAFFHALMAGTDTENPTFRLMLGVSTILVLALTAYRVALIKPAKKRSRAAA